MASADALKLLVAILAATVLGVNLSIVRPMKDRMGELKQEVSELESAVQLLIGQRDAVRNTNDLLSGLKAQEAIFEQTRHTLASIREMREQLAAECQKTTEVLASVEKLAVLQQTVLRHRDLTEPATKVLNETIALQKRLVEQRATADHATDAANRLVALKRNLIAEATDADAAEATLSRLADLKTQVVAQNDDLTTASDRAKQLIDLKNEIVDQSGKLDAATAAADGLLALKEQLVVRGGGTADAKNSADRLLALRDRLAESPSKTEAAEQSASRLLEIQRKLAGENPNLVDAIRSFESLIDLQREFQTQMKSLDGMRRGLMEIVMMENTVTRAVRTLQPLLELSNLRHLNESDLRYIARALAEQRTTRVSTHESPRGPSRAASVLGPSQYNREEDGAPEADPVPWPIDGD